MAVNISFEFFPPKTVEDEIKLQETSQTLAQYQPNYFSVTCGAGGSTRHVSNKVITDLHNNQLAAVAPHITCIGSERHHLEEQLLAYQAQGIQRLVALRGDLPDGMENPGELNFSDELIHFIREKTQQHFHIAVAGYTEGHPQASSIVQDLYYLKRKVDAGADAIITQYFYNPESYFYFVENCRKLGIEVPIIPGIMPIHHFKNLQRFSRMCGAEIPLWLFKHLDNYGDDVESMRAFAADVVARLCEKLLDFGAPSLHFYTLNQVKPTQMILERLISQHGR